MPIVIPYVPSYITVHLGPPNSYAANVTVPFTDYVKNVASSEIYPTWGESAIRANVWAIISFALNRVYTEFYRSRGYDFDITSSTAYDQNFVNGRNYFDSIARVVNDIFNSYIRRQGFVEPLAAKFCNGTTVTCDGLSQWGSEYLSQQGYSSVDIIHTYYGPDTEIVPNAPIMDIQESYPGTPLRVGSVGPNVVVVQYELNRISQNYPAIPKVTADGIFGPATENAVRAFQRIFGLEVDGIVGRSTWYELVRLTVGVQNLAELYSQGQRFYGISWEYPDAIHQGDTGEKVQILQYMLSVLSEFIPQIPSLTQDGIFGEQTRNAVLAFQQYAGLPQTGVVGDATWSSIYDQFAGISNTVSYEGETLISPASITPTAANTTASNTRLQLHNLGYRGRTVQQELIAFQRQNGIAPTGETDAATQRAMERSANPQRFAQTNHLLQFPGFTLSMGSKDAKLGGTAR